MAAQRPGHVAAPGAGRRIVRRRLGNAVMVFALIAGHGTALADAAASQASTIDAELASEIAVAAPGEMQDVIVRLRRQAALSTITASTRAARLRAVNLALRRNAATTQASIIELLEQRRAEGTVRTFDPYWVFNGLAVTATPAVIEELAARSDVARIVPDREIAVASAAAAAAAEPNVAQVQAPALWDLGYRGQGIVVANMDTGVDVEHPDLAGSWRGGSNSWFDPNGQHPTPADVNGHGTWTMGLMVGGDAGGTAVGMAPDARWIAVKIFDDSGIASSSDIHAGFQWLLDPDGDPQTADAPNVVNDSWSLGSIGCNLDFEADLESLQAGGILPIFAAGNYGPSVGTSASPGNNPGAFAVGATDEADAIDASSGRGPSACGEPQTTFPELVAPGVDVRTTDLFGTYRRVSGTSAAAAVVSGGLALLLDAMPDLTATAQADALEAGAVDLGAAGPDDVYGWGRLDVLASYGFLRPSGISIEVQPASAETTPGGTVVATIVATPIGAFGGDVDLALEGLSSTQATWTFTPDRIAAGSGSSDLRITTSVTLAPGTYPLTVTASSGAAVDDASFSMVVTEAPDFAIAVTPASRTIRRGSTTSYAVEVSSRGGFTGAVDLSVAGLPRDVTAAFGSTPIAGRGTATMTVTTRHRARKGTYILTVTGSSGATVHRASTALLLR